MSLKQREQLNSYIKDLNSTEESNIISIKQNNDLGILKSQKQLSQLYKLS